jgi:LuxR family maltose regulon positive regulatory protein
LLSGYLELARAYLALGQDQDALLAQETFAEWVAEEPVATDPAAYANQAWLQAQMGDMAAASRWVKNCGLELDQEPVRELEALVLIRIKLKQGQEEGAGQWLNKLLASAEAGEQWGRVVELLLLQALIFESQDNRPEALKAISRALAMAETEGYVRTFVDGGRPVAGLLGEVARSHGATEYLDRLLIAFQANTTGGRETSRTASPTSPTPVALVEPLSDRELEVLHLIAEGLTNREIAARLFLSPGTVKAHTHNIYGKLGVSGRTLAVATARSLNILD